MLHFIGHGDFDPGRDEGVLALVREDGRADRLVDLLRQARPMPRLVVLNSCSGATAGTGDLFSGTAAALVRGGVSAVAAMQYEISDPAAVAFARGFYAAIARGRGIDDAISSGRLAILGTGDRTLEWVTPVLYLRGHETRLFTLPASAEDTGQGTGSTRGGQPSGTVILVKAPEAAKSAPKPRPSAKPVVLPPGADTTEFTRWIGTATDPAGKVHDCEHATRNGHMTTDSARTCARKLLRNHPDGTPGMRAHPVPRDRTGRRVDTGL